MNQEEAYRYFSFQKGLGKARINVVPFTHYSKAYDPRRHNPLTMAEAFMQTVRESPVSYDIEDIFRQKVENTEDKINLIYGEISAREQIKNDNLSRLYADLLKVDNWRLSRHWYERDIHDRTNLKFDEMEMKIRDQIRKELKESAKDTAFPNKDMRESLLEFKLNNQKKNMMEDSAVGAAQDSLGGIGEMLIGAESPPGTNPGDRYRDKPIY